MVEGLRRLPMRPGMTFSLLPNNLAHSFAVLAGLPPLRLALVETSAMPASRHKRTAGGWAVTRTAMLEWRPVSSAGQLFAAGTSQVCGPGQLWLSCWICAGASGAR